MNNKLKKIVSSKTASKTTTMTSNKLTVERRLIDFTACKKFIVC